MKLSEKGLLRVFERPECEAMFLEAEGALHVHVHVHVQV